MRIAFYGSSLLSSYWNGAATYYRGLLADLARARPPHHLLRTGCLRPPAAPRHGTAGLGRGAGLAGEPRRRCATSWPKRAAADVVVKASGVGVFDDALLDGVMRGGTAGAIRIFWDVDAPATLAEMRAAEPDHPLRRALPALDLVLTYGGGPPVVEAYEGFGARRCVPIYNALDPATHHPVPPEPRFAADLSFLGNRLPDREARVEEFFLRPAAQLPGPPLPDRRQWLGRQGDAAECPRTSGMSTRASTTPSTPRRSRC